MLSCILHNFIPRLDVSNCTWSVTNLWEKQMFHQGCITNLRHRWSSYGPNTIQCFPWFHLVFLLNLTRSDYTIWSRHFKLTVWREDKTKTIQLTLKYYNFISFNYLRRDLRVCRQQLGKVILINSRALKYSGVYITDALKMEFTFIFVGCSNHSNWKEGVWSIIPIGIKTFWKIKPQVLLKI